MGRIEMTFDTKRNLVGSRTATSTKEVKREGKTAVEVW